MFILPRHSFPTTFSWFWLCLILLSFPNVSWGVKGRFPLLQTKTQKSTYSDPFSKKIMQIGKRLRKHLPSQWSMEWSFSHMRDIRWLAHHASGVRIRFVHQSKRVRIPKATPDTHKKIHLMQVVPLRCSVHFFPRKYTYKMHKSRIARIEPARIIGILKDSVVLQPNRFLAEEHPCPKIMQIVRKTLRIPTRGRPWFQDQDPIQHSSLFPYHLDVTVRRAAPWPWKYWGQRSKKRTIIVRYKTRWTEQITIFNRRKKKRRKRRR